MGSKYYFVSDVHLRPNAQDGEIPHKRFLSFLDHLDEDVEAVYFLGDIFDYWYEYKYTIPRGHTRVLGRLAMLSDRGVKLYFIPGNHDVWLYGFLKDEIGGEILQQPSFVKCGRRTFCIGHGDGLGYTALGFRFIRSIFHSRFLQKLYSAIHPRWSFALGYAWSEHSRSVKKNNLDYRPVFKGEDEPIYRYAQKVASENVVDCFVFGHFHIPTDLTLPSGERLFILGEWSQGCEVLIYDSVEDSFELVKPEM